MRSSGEVPAQLFEDIDWRDNRHSRIEDRERALGDCGSHRVLYAHVRVGQRG